MANTLSNSGGAAAALVFESTTFEVVDCNGQQWLKSGQLAQALGYADETAITKLYSRRKDEFTGSMSQTVNLTVQGQMRETRIFSLRGAHLLAMFARTSIAALFRKWVLDILDAQTHQPTLPAYITPTQKQHLSELVDLVVESGRQKTHGETWKRFHHKMKVNKYELLHPSQFDAACEYLRGKMDDASIAAIAQKHFPQVAALPAPEAAAMPEPFSLNNKRMLTCFDHQGGATMQFIPNDAGIISPTNISDVHAFVNEMVPLCLLPKVIDSANQRIARNFSALRPTIGLSTRGELQGLAA